MKTIYNLLVLLSFISLSHSIWANDTIQFTWKGSSNKSFYISATADKSFTVDWGNGSKNTYIGEGTNIINPKHDYKSTYNYTVTIIGNSLDCSLTYLSTNLNYLSNLDISRAPSLTSLNCGSSQLNYLDISKNTTLTSLTCYDNQLSTLDLSKNTVLTFLNCSYNRLDSLDVSKNTALGWIYCHNNSLSLANLYAISQKISNSYNKRLGPQTFSHRKVALNTPIVITNDVVVGGKNTSFTVNKNGVPATAGIDYTLTGNKITFKTDGAYTVIMTNAVITSYYDYPATVVIPFAAGMASNQQIKFSWSGSANKELRISATINKTFTIDWGDDSIITYTGPGTNQLILKHNYTDTKDYVITITGDSLDCFITLLYVRNLSINNLNLNMAPALITLSCQNNPLQNLDVSKNINLTTLHCDDNQLNSLDLSNNTKLTSLSCSSNAIPLRDLYLASQKVSAVTYKYLGSQTYPNQRISLDSMIAITSDSILGGIYTQFSISKNGGIALSGIDYMLTGAIITFKTAGVYTITMTNAAITSNSSFPAQATILYIAGNPEHQKISFTWKNKSSGNKNFSIEATYGKSFTINWGDDSVTNHIGGSGMTKSHSYKDTGSYTVNIIGDSVDCRFTYLDISYNDSYGIDVNKAPSLTTLLCNNNQISDLDISKNTALNTVTCSSNKLKVLDVSNNTLLNTLNCSYNQISSLDISKNTALSTIYCYNNILPLSNLYIISQKISNTSYKWLGTQTFPKQYVSLDTAILITYDSLFDGFNTQYTISKNGGKAVPNVDYRLIGAKVIFKTDGLYTITMTQQAISSYPNYPAQVVITYEAGMPEPPNIIFTWQGAVYDRSFSMAASTGKTFTINWGDGSINTYTGEGTTNLTIYHKYLNNNDYTVTIAGDSLDCFFTYLNLSSKFIKSLDVSKIPTLTTLNCTHNQLNTLNLSKNPGLTSLDCYNNQLSTLNLNYNTSLASLNCSNNKIDTLDVSKNIALTSLSCNDNQLKALDISKNIALASLYCCNNQLSSLDISKNTELSSIRCFNNALLLADLYAASEKIYSTYNKYLGTQTLPNREAALDIATLITPDSVLRYRNTSFSINKNDGTAIEGIDYILNGAYITFKISGFYTITMTYDVIESYYNYPAKVIVNYTAGNIENQNIIFTWKGSTSSKSFYIAATTGKTFTINWGDGSTNTYTGKGTTNFSTSHTYKNTDNYTVTITGDNPDCYFTYLNLSITNQIINSLDINKATSLITLFCYNSPLETLDISKNTALEDLYCYGNKIQSLDISNNPVLKNLYCYNNQIRSLNISNTGITNFQCYNNALPLADLYAASEKISSTFYKYLGTQTLQNQKVNLDTAILITSDTIFNSINTTYSVKKNGGIAIAETDYILTGNRIIFRIAGSYQITMTNAAIISTYSYPSQVMVTFIAGNPIQQEITFTWTGSTSQKSFYMAATTDKTFRVNWGDDSVNTYTGKGTSNITLSHTYKNTQNYTVTITGDSLDCFFTYLQINNNAVNSLDVSQALSLNTLQCHTNQLTVLDLSKHTALSTVYCYNNALPLGDLYVASQKISNTSYKYLGTQTLPTQKALMNTTLVLTPDSVLGGVNTVFDISSAASGDMNYVLTGNKITFKADGVYTITMTNSAITSSYSYPPKVVVTYVVGNPKQQKITFNWPGSTSNKSFSLQATNNRTLKVNWGDDNTTTHTGQGSSSLNLSHKYDNTNIYTVTIIGDSMDCIFTYLSISGQSINSLNVSEAPGLVNLQCQNNQLTTLDVSKNNALTNISCSNNALPLKDLYTASQKISNESNKSLGTQNFLVQEVGLDTVFLLTPDSVLGGIKTSISISKNGSIALADIDYVLTGTQITFKTSGFYTITMTNGAIKSNASYPAQIMATYMVGDPGQQKISFTWKGNSSNNSFLIQASIIKTFKVNWGDGDQNISSYTGTGTTSQMISHNYADTNMYNVSVYGGSLDCYLTYLDISYKAITNLDLSKTNTLTSLDCFNNKLSSLDISNNNSLTYLNCSSNQLSSLNIGKNSSLTTLICYGNALSLKDLYLASTQISNIYNKSLGTQTLPIQKVNLGTSIIITPDSILNNINTAYIISKNGDAAIAGTDYILNGAHISFKNAGIYVITMTNAAITSNPSYPAKVITTFEVNTYTDATLQSLSVSKGTLSPNFISNIIDYTVNLPYADSTISVTGIANNSMAIVTGNVTDTALAIGKNIINIIVTAEDGITKTTYAITIIRAVEVIKVTGITITPASLSIKVDSIATLTSIITPSNATNQNVNWASTNSNIVTVNNGIVTAKSEGTVYIVATTVDGGFKDSCLVTVTTNIISVTGISISSKSLSIKIDSTKTLTVTITPNNATNQNVNWASTNSNIATVNNGIVTAKSEGTAYIVVTTVDGGLKDSCLVTVAANVDATTEIDLENHIAIYPNPTNGKLKIESENLKINKVQIYDMVGKLVFETKETSFDIAHLPKNIYFVKIHTDKGFIVKKFVKQ